MDEKQHLIKMTFLETISVWIYFTFSDVKINCWDRDKSHAGKNDTGCVWDVKLQHRRCGLDTKKQNSLSVNHLNCKISI